MRAAEPFFTRIFTGFRRPKRKLRASAHTRSTSASGRVPGWRTNPVEYSVVMLDNILWLTRGPNVYWTIGSTMRSTGGAQAKSTCKWHGSEAFAVRCRGARLGLSRRRSRVRVPSLPSSKVPKTRRRRSWCRATTVPGEGRSSAFRCRRCRRCRRRGGQARGRRRLRLRAGQPAADLKLSFLAELPSARATTAGRSTLPVRFRPRSTARQGDRAASPPR